MTLRLGQVVDAELVRMIDAIAQELLPELDQRPPLTYKEAAALLGCHPRTLQRKVRAGSIPFVQVGKRVRFRPDQVRQMKAAKVTGEWG